jgi:hypothetical protein
MDIDGGLEIDCEIVEGKKGSRWASTPSGAMN